MYNSYFILLYQYCMKIVGGSLRLSGSFYVMIVQVTIKIFENLKQIITMTCTTTLTSGCGCIIIKEKYYLVKT